MKIKLDPGAFCPTRAHETDAGLDLYATEDKVVPPYGSAIFDTGVHVQLPPFTAGFLKSKSGLNVKHGITSEGVIDVGLHGFYLREAIQPRLETVHRPAWRQN